MKYTKPELTITEFKTEDIIITSGLSSGGGGGDDGHADMILVFTLNRIHLLMKMINK